MDVVCAGMPIQIPDSRATRSISEGKRQMPIVYKFGAIPVNLNLQHMVRCLRQLVRVSQRQHKERGQDDNGTLLPQVSEAKAHDSDPQQRLAKAALRVKYSGSSARKPQAMPTLVKALPKFEDRLEAFEKKYRNASTQAEKFTKRLENGERPGNLVPVVGVVVYKAQLRYAQLADAKTRRLRITF